MSSLLVSSHDHPPPTAAALPVRTVRAMWGGANLEGRPRALQSTGANITIAKFDNCALITIVQDGTRGAATWIEASQAASVDDVDLAVHLGDQEDSWTRLIARRVGMIEPRAYLGISITKEARSHEAVAAILEAISGAQQRNA